MHLKVDYDTLWKELINEFFEDFTAFFMPKLHKDIDFLRPCIYTQFLADFRR